MTKFLGVQKTYKDVVGRPCGRGGECAQEPWARRELAQRKNGTIWRECCCAALACRSLLYDKALVHAPSANKAGRAVFSLGTDRRFVFAICFPMAVSLDKIPSERQVVRGPAAYLICSGHALRDGLHRYTDASRQAVRTATFADKNGVPNNSRPWFQHFQMHEPCSPACTEDRQSLSHGPRDKITLRGLVLAGGQTMLGCPSSTAPASLNGLSVLPCTIVG